MVDINENLSVDPDDTNAEACKVTGVIPVIGITSCEEAVAYYIDWLGFKIDWEWREAPNQPVIMAISRDDVSFMLNEADEYSIGSWLTFSVTNLYALADEWSVKRPGEAKVVVEPPYDIPSIFLTDPFGNRMDFQQPMSTQEEKAMRYREALMEDYIRQQLDDGNPCPTPEEVVKVIGRPLGLAMDVLCRFPEYEQATRGDVEA